MPIATKTRASLQRLYKRTLPFELRYWLYKLRNNAETKQLRSTINPSPKGDFSLKPFDENHCIFVHITKSAGTSLAKSLFGYLPYHYTASQYRVIYGRKTFADYYSFAFVRNPWDRLYSAYSYLKDGGWNAKDKAWAEENLAECADFNDFVCNWLTKERLNSHIHFWPQSRFICNDKGKPIINDIYYFETIADDFATIAQKLGKPATLAHTNRSQRESYREAYNEQSIKKVQALYATDIKNFGYSFDSLNRKKISQQALVNDD